VRAGMTEVACSAVVGGVVIGGEADVVVGDSPVVVTSWLVDGDDASVVVTESLPAAHAEKATTNPIISPTHRDFIAPPLSSIVIDPEAGHQSSTSRPQPSRQGERQLPNSTSRRSTSRRVRQH